MVYQLGLCATRTRYRAPSGYISELHLVTSTASLATEYGGMLSQVEHASPIDRFVVNRSLDKILPCSGHSTLTFQQRTRILIASTCVFLCDMSRKLKVEGLCRICGTTGPLTFDHVPPKRCFNNFPGYYEASVDTLLALDKAGEYPDMNTVVQQRKARKRQGGIGFNSLCQACNNNTGSWYGSEFAEWVHQSMGILLKANGQPSLVYPTFFFPLRVIKQIITMFLSIDDGHLRADYPALSKFILNREERFLDKAYKVYAYYNLEGSPRYLPRTFMTNGRSTEIIIMSEITFPPFGFVLSMKGPKPAPEITDISHFARFKYDEWTDFYQRLPVLPTHLPNIPGDYRTRQEIEEAIRSSRQEQLRRNQM